MPSLDWIGKSAVLNHHREVTYRLLRCDESLSAGDPDTGNLLVEGDNLLALKALLPYYAGQVKCIYIDPPYNTGEEKWTYNDNVNSPSMQKWIQAVVGKENEDLTRHDKWLCMMYPRLTLLRQFLRRDGVIFISIDDNEVGHLHLLMNDIFGPRNMLGTLVWKRRSPSAMRGTPLSTDHEHIISYGIDIDKTALYGLSKGIEDYPYQDERGNYTSTDLTVGMNKDSRPGQFYTIQNPRTGKTYYPNPERVWRFHPDTMQKVIANDLIIWPDESPHRNMERPRYKTYHDPDTDKPKPVSSWIESTSVNDRQIQEIENEYDVTILHSGMTQEGGKLLQQIIGSRTFAYPKPLSLVRSVIRASTRSNDLILDSFAGTGTTGHATLDINTEDGGTRRFILIELESDICRGITAERLKRVIEGYSYERIKGGTVDIPPLRGGFRYCRLGEPLFTAEGHIREGVTFRELAAHIFIAETGRPLPHPPGPGSPLLGTAENRAVCLLWGDGGSVLDRRALAALPQGGDVKIVYADSCLIPQEHLREAGVVFKQIPYSVRTC